MRFYLGTHMTNWLALVDVPLFISDRRLAGRRDLPVARAPWALDSGGFTQLQLHGGWPPDAAKLYAERVDRYRAEIGRLAWVSPQDWMCEPHMIERTGLSVRDHQEHTIANYLELRPLIPEVVPVLQGWRLAEYLTCLDLYRSAGVDLTAQPVVGLGSVCRRQDTTEIETIVRELHRAGLALHGYGVKTNGLASYGRLLASADSMAWSFRARRTEPMPGRTHRSCANCLRYALRWRDNVLARQRWQQLTLDDADVGSASRAATVDAPTTADVPARTPAVQVLTLRL